MNPVQCDTCQGFAGPDDIGQECFGQPGQDPPCGGTYFEVLDWSSRLPLVQTLHDAQYKTKTVTAAAARPAMLIICNCSLAPAPTDVVVTWDKGVELGTSPRRFWGPDGVSRAATPREVWW